MSMLGYLKDKNKNEEAVFQQDQNMVKIERELELYKRAFTAIKEVSVEASKGNIEARIISWDTFGELSSVMANINQMMDLTDAFVREAGASLEAAQEGHYYRQFLPQGMGGSFGTGAKIINNASKNMEKLDLDQKNQRHQLADNFEETVMSVVTEMEVLSQQFNASAQNMIKDATSTQELSVSVSASSEEATLNVQTVASAAEELSSSIAEISNQVETSAAKTSVAKEQVVTALDTISELHQASATINEVVDLINNVAKQTNLLALNATIEAARAGEAGKGFAVVASEVKVLSQKTAEATDKIKNQVENMQSRTKATVEMVNNISNSIENLNEIATSIAASTEQQSVATVEISRNIQEASLGTQDVSTNISHVSNTANETMDSATELLASAEKIGKQTLEMNQQSRKFVEGIRSL